MKLSNHVGTFFASGALSLCLTTLIVGEVYANESVQAAGNAKKRLASEPVDPSTLQEFNSARRHLENAVQRALKGLQGEPLQIFESNQAEWEQLFTAESGMDSILNAFVPSNAQSSETVDLQYANVLIKRRSSWIHGLMDHLKNRGGGLTGFWSDNRGGWMSLVDQDGVIYFSASCIRGRDHYQGHVRGHAVKNGKCAIFKDTPMDEEVKILFTKKGPWLRVEGTNTDVYHGLQAYFDGDYVKIAPLTPAKQKLVISSSKEPLP